MKSKARFLPFAGALILLASLFMFSTASAQALGTVKLSKSFITTPDGELTITVEDADLNTGVIQRDEKAGRGRQRGSTVQYVIRAVPSGYDYDHSFVFRTSKAPILSVSPSVLFDKSELSSTADTFVDFQDVTLRLGREDGSLEAPDYEPATLQAWSVITSDIDSAATAAGVGELVRHPYTLENPGGGAFTLGRNLSTDSSRDRIDFDEDIYFYATYLAPDVQTAQVRITSTTDTRGVQVKVAETLPNTGKFTRIFKTVLAPQTTHIVDLRPGVREDHINLNLDGNNRAGARSAVRGTEGNLRTADRSADITDAVLRKTTEAFIGIDLNGDGDYNPTMTMTTSTPPGTVTVPRTVDWIDIRQATGATLPPNQPEVLVPSPWEEPRLGWLMDTAPADAGDDWVPTWTDTDVRGVQCTASGGTIDPERRDIDGDLVRICWTGPVVQIAAAPGALVRTTYSDGGVNRVANATVETTKPTIRVIEPAHKSATRVTTARLIAEITDADSGVDTGKDNVNIVFNVDPTNLAGGSVAGPGVGVNVVTTVTISGGVRAETTLTGVPPGETLITWSVTARDNAGNVSTSDQNPATTEIDSYELRVDTVAPDLGTLSIDYDGSGMAEEKTVEGAITGNYLDDENNAITDATKGRNTSVRMVFNEPLDASTVQPSDFRVNGVAPAEVSVSSKHPESVFLTVPTFASDARPDVRLTGPISDTAGNRRQGGLRVESAQDGVSPNITVTINPNYHQEEVTIEVESDEALLTAPTIRLSGAGTEGTPAPGATGLSAASLAGSDLYRATFKPDTQPFAYNVNVDVLDTSANPRSVGKAKADDDDAITAEIDKSLPAQTSVTLPGQDPITTIDTSKTYNVTTRNPFITIEWDSEAKEYGRITDGMGTDRTSDDTSVLTNDAADIANPGANKTFKSLDTHGAVDFTNLKIKVGDDTYDIATPMGDASSARTPVDIDEDTSYTFVVTKPTENRLLIAVRGLELGDYQLSFNGRDELGNTRKSDVSIKIAVKDPDPFEVKLNPGWNLVSLPSAPDSTAINDVIPADHPATVVLTYDPTEPGGWLSANRGEDGMFTGTLTDITGNVGYWIFTDSFDSFKVQLRTSDGGGTNTLPTVNLVQGWNLVPVLDITGAKKFGADRSTLATYIGSDAVRAYQYDGSTNRYTVIEPGGAALKIGTGYWVYMSKAAVIVP